MRHENQRTHYTRQHFPLCRVFDDKAAVFLQTVMGRFVTDGSSFQPIGFLQNLMRHKRVVMHMDPDFNFLDK